MSAYPKLGLQLVYSSTRNPVFRQNLAVIRSVMKGFSTADICDIFMISETNFYTNCVLNSQGITFVLSVQSGSQ